MPTQRFIIEYEAKKPLFPVNKYRFPLHKGFEKDNLDTLRTMIRLLFGGLQLLPRIPRFKRV